MNQSFSHSFTTQNSTGRFVKSLPPRKLPDTRQSQFEFRSSEFFREHADDLKTDDLFWFQSRKLSTLAAEHKAFPHARYGNMDRYEGHCDYLFRERHDFGMIPLLSFLARNRDKIPHWTKKSDACVM